MSNTDEDRKLAEEVQKIIWDTDYVYKDAIPRLRALFATSRQVTEAEIEAAARAACECPVVGLSRTDSQSWDRQGQHTRDSWIAHMRAAFAAISLYTPPTKPSPGEKFEDLFNESDRPVSAMYDAATTKAIEVCQEIVDGDRHESRGVTSRAKAALADLRCEGNK